jgi:hypothetical protein
MIRKNYNNNFHVRDVYTTDSSTVVERLSHHVKAVGLSPVIAPGAGRKKLTGN